MSANHSQNKDLSALLDRLIAGLMVAIALTLAWPVSRALWAQPQPSGAAICMQEQATRSRIFAPARRIRAT